MYCLLVGFGIIRQGFNFGKLVRSGFVSIPGVSVVLDNGNSLLALYQFVVFLIWGKFAFHVNSQSKGGGWIPSGQKL